LIDDDAIQQLRTRLTRKDRGSGTAISMCYPLVVNNLLTKALNEAAVLGVPRVTRDVISAF
jgi:type II secretory pathway predicted ATPase ExeA